jgi:hypothetical protein
LLRRLGRFGGWFIFTTRQLFANLLGDIHRDRARVRLFFRDAVAGEQVNNCFGFDL